MLDAYFKKFFWTFVLGAIFVGAFFTAKTVNAYLGQSLMVSPADLTRGSARGPRRAKKATATLATNAFLERNLFGAEREDLVKADELAAAAAAEAATTEAAALQGEVNLANCSPSTLGANLMATFVDDRNPEASMAVFQDTTPEKKVKGHRVGDKLLDQAEVVAIEWRNVFINNGGKCESFSLEEKKKPAARAVAKAQPAKPAAGADGMGEGIEKKGDNEYTIPRQEIDNVLSNLNKVATQARIVPSFKNGKANGFKLFSIRPNSLYSKIGIQNGDIVQKINGYEINSPDKALEIYSKLKDAQSITVDLVRRGKSQTLSYSIR